jgi:hypothetical protein
MSDASGSQQIETRIGDPLKLKLLMVRLLIDRDG